MEYISFTVIVAAGGALIFWIWYRGYTAEANSTAARGNGLPEAPVPPRKRTVSGQTDTETEQIAFQRRMEEWDAAFQARRGKLNGYAHSLKGTRYTFVPRKRNGEPISNSA